MDLINTIKRKMEEYTFEFDTPEMRKEIETNLKKILEEFGAKNVCCSIVDINGFKQVSRRMIHEVHVQFQLKCNSGKIYQFQQLVENSTLQLNC